jgi:hypothetical protein
MLLLVVLVLQKNMAYIDESDWMDETYHIQESHRNNDYST